MVDEGETGSANLWSCEEISRTDHPRSLFGFLLRLRQTRDPLDGRS